MFILLANISKLLNQSTRFLNNHCRTNEMHFQCIASLYSGPPLMRPPLGNDKTGRIRGVAAGEGEVD